MKKRKFFETGILIIALILFAFQYDITFIRVWKDKSILGIVIVAAFLVNVIKMIRLYIILFGKNVSGVQMCELYSKTAIVNSVIPYKLGEVYRFWMIGKMLQSPMEGIIITILDRFMDTLGLLIVILLNLLVTNNSLIFYPVVVVLILFVVLAFLAYFLFPNLSKFWNRLLIVTHGSPRKLWALEVLAKLEVIYKHTKDVIKGRGVMLVSLSVLAWLIEIGATYIVNAVSMKETHLSDITSYLYSILIGERLYDSARYTVASVIVLVVIIVYVEVLKCIRKEEKNENYSGLR